MTALRSELDPQSPSSRATPTAMRALVADLRAKLDAAIRKAAATRRARRHTARGKLLPRDRVDALLDPGTPFLELSPLAAHGMYGGDVAVAPASITGIGRVTGRECVDRRQRRHRQGRHLLSR